MKIYNTAKPVLAVLPLALLVACASQQTGPSAQANTETNSMNSHLFIAKNDTGLTSENKGSMTLPEQLNDAGEVNNHGKIENKNPPPAAQESEVLAMAQVVEDASATPKTATHDSQPASTDQTVITNEGKDMTTLVIENPDLFNQQVATMTATSAQQGELFEKNENALPKDQKVFFGFGKNSLNDSDIERIRKAGQYLAKNPQMRVILHGHTDARGQDNFNRELSVKRAETVASILKEEGAKAGQIDVFGWGSQRPLVSNTLYQENRRVEIQFEEVKFAAN
ncbi:MAG: OmpA family protein [Hahellaceae bacterium]|jgi:outer membrane protein OmpA-like peptidoglycan-associated protein|nr:OmpA family protein [Hahellaceae bacterium]MCP5210427.1 OmpA family protein [Hahellaceae bacterium]